MRAEGVGWEDVGERLGKSSMACRLHFTRLKDKLANLNWSKEDDEKFKLAYKKNKEAMWNMIACEMGFEGNWKALEARAFGLGIKRLKNFPSTKPSIKLEA
jgi:hypothetical protein